MAVRSACRRPWVARVMSTRSSPTAPSVSPTPRADEQRAVGRDVEDGLGQGRPGGAGQVVEVVELRVAVGPAGAARPRRTAAARAAPGSGPSTGSGTSRRGGPRRRRPCAPSRARRPRPGRRRRGASGRGGPGHRSSRRRPSRRCRAGGASEQARLAAVGVQAPEAGWGARPWRRRRAWRRGPGRLEVKTSEPSGRKAAWLSPAADRVRRRGARRAGRIDAPERGRAGTCRRARGSRPRRPGGVPSGESRSPDSRGARGMVEIERVGHAGQSWHDMPDRGTPGGCVPRKERDGRRRRTADRSRAVDQPPLSPVPRHETVGFQSLNVPDGLLLYSQ